MNYEERMKLHEHFKECPEDYVGWNKGSCFSGMDPLSIVIAKSFENPTSEEGKRIDEWLKAHGLND